VRFCQNRGNWASRFSFPCSAGLPARSPSHFSAEFFDRAHSSTVIERKTASRTSPRAVFPFFFLASSSFFVCKPGPFPLRLLVNPVFPAFRPRANQSTGQRAFPRTPRSKSFLHVRLQVPGRHCGRVVSRAAPFLASSHLP